MENSSLTYSHQLIINLIPVHSVVLDLGCGTGDLLESLVKVKNVRGRGVEIDENMVIECLKRGISVFQGNIDEGLKEYPDKSYDFVILNQTLQAVYNTEFLLKEMLRVGKKAIVGIPNFANWRIRRSLGFRGELPVTRTFPSEWYNTATIRLVTIRDFKKICKRLKLSIQQEYYSANNKDLPFPLNIAPNWFSENALFVIEN